VEIFSRDKALKAALESEASCRRHYGAEMCKKIQLRLAALSAAGSLADFWPSRSGPERCHELKGPDAGTFSIDVKQPYRLLFKPVESEEPLDRSNEQARWSGIKAVELLEIRDTHG
jgi:plasmid maintenance system killer protein